LLQELTLYGVQRRDVACRHVCHDAAAAAAAADTPPDRDNDAAACRRSSDRPASERLCRLACRRDCVVTELGPWSACCGGRRSRRRRVLVGPRDGGRPCRAPMIETTRCDVDDDDDDGSAEACGGGEAALAAAARRRPVYRVGRWSECQQVRGQR